MSDTTNDFSGEAHTVVQAGTTGHVVNQPVQIVYEGHAIIGDVYGGVHYGGSTPKPTDGQEQQA
jgi:hypothetical protein